MFRIAICEDEKAQGEYLKKLLFRWQEMSGNKVSVDTFYSAEHFLFEAEGKKAYDLLILDIQMGEMNGVELARRVKMKDTRVKIVFLTGIRDYAIEGYEVGAVRYLLKPVKEADFFALFDKLAKEAESQEEEWFVFRAGDTVNRVAVSDILYVEADGHYVILKVFGREGTACNPKGQGLAEGKLKEWKWKASFSSLSEELDAKGFFLLRRGLYVNLARVEQIGKTECTLEDGEVLPVSKSRYKELNEWFIAFYKGMTE
ncbi:MAG: LytR/AlgR family response regulator transcription factor [Lachnospiraceae bacterium]